MGFRKISEKMIRWSRSIKKMNFDEEGQAFHAYGIA